MDLISFVEKPALREKECAGNLGSHLSSHQIKEGCLASILAIGHRRTGSKSRKLGHFKPLRNQVEIRGQQLYLLISIDCNIKRP